MSSIKTSHLLILIFLIALVLRFLYFPNNIYFGIDQARDAFVSMSIFQGDLKIVGPPTSVPGLFHGPLYYYIFAPIYFFAGGNPEAVSAFLRIVNAAGVFIVYLIAVAIFNRKVGLISAFLYAISFEQTQFAIYLNHPSLAVISVLLFYLGWVVFIFKRNIWGFLLAAISLGLSIQFEFAETYLVLSFIIFVVLFFKQFREIPAKVFLYSVIGLFICLSTFFVTEIVFGFKTIGIIPQIIAGDASHNSLFQKLATFKTINLRSLYYNLGDFNLGLLILSTLAILFYFKQYKYQFIFLLIWFLSGNIPYFKDTSILPLYYHLAGSTVAALVLASFFINQLARVNRNFFLLLIIPIISNFNLITNLNTKGSLPDFNVQSGMLLSDQKKAIDYMYQKSEGEEFSIYGLTMPLYINMTWAYLFEWYGEKKYKYLPIWGGENAPGYYGNLKVETAKSNLPENRFFIMEPTHGIPGYFIDGFKKEENIFTDLVEEKQFGQIIVQQRKPKRI